MRGALALLVSAVALGNASYETTPEVFKVAMTMEGKPGRDTDSPSAKVTGGPGVGGQTG